MPLPTISTTRLLLRPFVLSDAEAVRRLAGDPAIADTTLLIPHPYPELMAEAWIRTHPERFARGEGAEFAVVLRECGDLVGAVGLSKSRRHDRAEIGYWIGVPCWGHGYATEAVRAVMRVAFADFALNRIEGHHFSRNPASGRVLQKAGFHREGLARQYVRKGEAYEDCEFYAATRSEWQRRLTSGRRPAMLGAVPLLSALVARGRRAMS
jgi:RimJ/RimL family protein N-acetyltransferase